MTYPLVSVIMPVYNAENTIKRAINSLFLQTYKNWELVIVNDGSTDQTSEILKHYRKFSNIFIIEQENKGRGYSRNVALRHCNGKYLSFLDADDFIHPKKIEYQVDYLENNNDIRLISTAMSIVYNNQLIARTMFCSEIDVKIVDSKTSLEITCAPCMLRNDLTKDIQYKTYLNSGEDIDFLYRYLLGYKYAHTSISFYYYDNSDITKGKMYLYALQSLKKSLKEKNNIINSLIKYLCRSVYYFCTSTRMILNQRYSTKCSDIEILEFKDILNKLKLMEV